MRNLAVDQGNVKISDLKENKTSFVMASKNKTISATYEYNSYRLTIIGESGSGTYTSGQLISISMEVSP